MRQLKDFCLFIKYELHGFRIYLICVILEMESLHLCMDKTILENYSSFLASRTIPNKSMWTPRDFATKTHIMGFCSLWIFSVSFFVFRRITLDVSEDVLIASWAFSDCLHQLFALQCFLLVQQLFQLLRQLIILLPVLADCRFKLTDLLLQYISANVSGKPPVPY